MAVQTAVLVVQEDFLRGWSGGDHNEMSDVAKYSAA